MKNFMCVIGVLTCLWIPSRADAYLIRVGGQALSNSDANAVTYNQSSVDNLTEIFYSTGLVQTNATDPSFAGSAMSQSGVDLSTGELKLYGISDGGAYTDASAMAEFIDQVQFNFTGTVEFSLDVNGFVQELATGSSGSTLFIQASLGNTDIGTLSITDSTSVLGQTYTGSLFVTAGQWYEVSAQIYLANYAQTETDMLHTGTFDFILPESGSFTSESGVFLTASSSPAPVPEPATALLLGSGLLGFFGTRLKRKMR